MTEPAEPLNHLPLTVVEQADKVIDEVKSMEQINVPSTSTWKPYEDYRCITDTTSDQWKLLRGEEVTYGSGGVLRISDCFAAALGNNFGSVGTRFVFLLEGADRRRKAVRIIKADEKQDQHTLNGAGWVGENGHILEMIVDTGRMDEDVKASGSCNGIPELEGKVIAIFKEE